MAKVQKKVKRPRIDWYQVMRDIGDPRMDADFYLLWKRMHFGSKSRVAYNVLKRYYSTTSLENFRWLGTPLL